MIFHIPNGGRRSKSEGARFKKMGVLAGIPDLFIAEALNDKHGLFIELKTDKGRSTSKQLDAQAELRLRGYEVHECHGFGEFQNIVRKYIGG